MEDDKVTIDKINKYRKISTQALELAKENITKGKEKQAKEIIEMVEAYISDSKHFEEKKDLVNALACLSYAHGWIDSGARLKIFDVKDNRLFTI